MRGIKVLMVLDSMEYGGTETHVLSMVKVMQKKGAEILIAGGAGAFSNQLNREMTVFTLPWPAYDQGYWISELSDVIRRESIDIIHAHQAPSGAMAAFASERLGIPFVYTTHGMYYSPYELEAISKRATCMISVSKPVHSFLERYQVKSRIISNGIDLERFSPSEPEGLKLRRQLGISESARVLLYASRLAWEKATVCNQLLMASKQLRRGNFPDLEVVIVGGGIQYEELQRQAMRIEAEIGSPFIHMVGPQDNMPDYYRMSDCVVGTGRVALEAMACGKPVLAAGNSGYLGWVSPGNYDIAWELYLGDHGSLRAANRLILFEALRKGLSSKDSLMFLGSTGRDWITEKFNVETTVSATLDIYNEALRHRDIIIAKGRSE